MAHRIYCKSAGEIRASLDCQHLLDMPKSGLIWGRFQPPAMEKYFTGLLSKTCPCFWTKGPQCIYSLMVRAHNHIPRGRPRGVHPMLSTRWAPQRLNNIRRPAGTKAKAISSGAIRVYDSPSLVRYTDCKAVYLGIVQLKTGWMGPHPLTVSTRRRLVAYSVGATKPSRKTSHSALD